MITATCEFCQLIYFNVDFTWQWTVYIFLWNMNKVIWHKNGCWLTKLKHFMKLSLHYYYIANFSIIYLESKCDEFQNTFDKEKTSEDQVHNLKDIIEERWSITVLLGKHGSVNTAATPVNNSSAHHSTTLISFWVNLLKNKNDKFKSNFLLRFEDCRKFSF